MNKYIVFNLKALHNFQEYGIEIPLLNSRVLKTLAGLSIQEESFPSQWDVIKEQDLLLAHTSSYVHKVKTSPDEVVYTTYELKKNDGSFYRYHPQQRQKPLSNFIKKAQLHIAGTYIAAKKALSQNFCYHLGGGMHHAMSSRPGGFCMFNDLVIAVRKLQKEELLQNVLIVDLDCHKGDGTA